MAISITTIPGPTPVTPSALAAPTVSEQIVDPGNDVILYFEVGATPTTVTVVRPGTHSSGDNVADFVIGPLTSTTRFVRIGAEYADPVTGNATVLFSQVAAVLARLIRA